MIIITVLYLFRTALLRKNPRLNMPINTIVCSICFFYALPATIAIFPQMSEVDLKILFIIKTN